MSSQWFLTGTYAGKLVCFLNAFKTLSLVTGIAAADAPITLPGKRVISIFPNPFKDYLHVAFSPVIGSSMDVTVFDRAGKRVLSRMNEKFADEVHLPLPQMAAGFYLLHIKAGSAIITEKIIKL